MSKKELVAIRLEVLEKLKKLFRPPDFIYEKMVKDAEDIDFDFKKQNQIDQEQFKRIEIKEEKASDSEAELSYDTDVFELSTDDQYFLVTVSDTQHKKEQDAGGRWAYVVGIMRKEYTSEEIDEINSWTDDTLINFIEKFCKNKIAKINDKKINNRPLIARLVKFLFKGDYTIENVYNKYKNYIDVDIQVEVSDIATDLINEDEDMEMESPRIIAEREIRKVFSEQEIEYILRWGDNLQSIFMEIKSGTFDDDIIDDTVKLTDLKESDFFDNLFEKLIKILFIKGLIDEKIQNDYIGEGPIEEEVKDTSGLVIDETDDEEEETTDEEQEDKDKEETKRKIMNMIKFRYGEDKIKKLYKLGIGFELQKTEDSMILINMIRQENSKVIDAITESEEGRELYNEFWDLLTKLNLPEIEDDEEDSSEDESSDIDSD